MVILELASFSFNIRMSCEVYPFCEVLYVGFLDKQVFWLYSRNDISRIKRRDKKITNFNTLPQKNYS